METTQDMTDETKLHWFCFIFRYMNSSTQGIANTYMGYPDTNITLERINHARKKATIVNSSVLANIIPLGYMTKSEFEGKQE